jgi:predicted DNA-binding protein
MDTLKKTSTTEMQVTSIRLERELKDRLRDIAGEQGYQTLIRDILWNYVQNHGEVEPSKVSLSDIRMTLAAIAQQEETCVLTGRQILPKQPLLLGWTKAGKLVPLSLESMN